MTIKCTYQKKTRKVSPLTGLALLLISVVLFIITIPLGLLYGLIFKLITKSITGIGEFGLKIAISLDQLGNVSMQYLLNEIMIVKGGYKFGNRDETISSVIGKNEELDTLSNFGRFINKILNIIDPNHSLNSIDYFIEPLDNFIKK